MSKILIKIFLTSLILTGCTNPTGGNSTDKSNKESNPAVTASPLPGSGACSNACVELTQNIETDIKLVNPDNKKSLDRNDLGIGTDSYLSYRFDQCDKDKSNSLDLDELKEYLSGNNFTKLASVCKCKKI